MDKISHEFVSVYLHCLYDCSGLNEQMCKFKKTHECVEQSYCEQLKLASDKVER